MKKTTLLVISILLLLPIFADAASAKKKFQLAHVSVESPEDMYQFFALRFQEGVEKLSNGSIAIEILGNAQLGGERDVAEGMQFGTVDMGILANFTFGPFDPKTMVFDLPYLFYTYEEAFRVLDSDVTKDVENSLQKIGFKVLGWGHGGFRNLYTTFGTVKELDDVRAKKIRVPQTPIYVDTWRALGANATSMAYSELFTGLQQKTIDGAENPASLFYTSHFYEAARYLSRTEHVYVSLPLVISTKLWEKLSAEEQQSMQKAASEAVKVQRQFFLTAEDDVYKKLADLGVTINQTVNKDAFRKAVLPVYETYKKQIGEDLLNKVLALVKK